MKTCIKSVLVLISSLTFSSATWGAACTSGTLADYTVVGFSCTLDDIQFSEFIYTANFIGSTPSATANTSSAITVTPQLLGDTKGFAFANMNVMFSGGFSNINSGVHFEVDAVENVITGANVQLGTHSTTGVQGRAQASLRRLFR